jgi:hypothetical protein
MRETLKSQLQNSGSCLLGFLLGLGFSGTVVLSDAFNSKPQPSASAISTISLPKKAENPAPAQQHILKTARAVPSGGSAPLAPRRAAASLNPETIEMLQNLQPTARGKLPKGTLLSTEQAVTRTATLEIMPNAPVQATTQTVEAAAGSADEVDAGALYRLHLASVSNRANVKDAIEQLAGLHPALLKDVPIAAQAGPVQDGSGGFTRIYAGSYAQRTTADTACDAFKEVGQYCAVMSTSQ